MARPLALGHGKKTYRWKRRELWLAATLFASLLAVAAQSNSPLETALHYFTEKGTTDFFEQLDRARPAAVSPREKEAVLRGLPPEGDIPNLDAGQRRKLAAARRVLELHGRESIYAIKVIEVPQAVVALHARVVVLRGFRRQASLDKVGCANPEPGLRCRRIQRLQSVGLGACSL